MNAEGLGLGVSTSVLGPGNLPARVALLAGRGIQWLEIHGYTRDEFDFTNEGLVQAMARALERDRIALWSCHSPAEPPLDVAAPDARIRADSARVMRQAMVVTARLGARVFVCDAARPASNAADRAARRRGYAESLRELLEAAASLRIVLAIENHARTRDLFSSPDDFTALVREYGLTGLGACWDTGHGWIGGQPPVTACRLGDALATLHIHDNDGTRDRHRIPTTGSAPDWEGFVAGLRSIRYRGPFMMEIVSPDHRREDSIAATLDRALEVYRRLVTAR